MQNNQRIIGIFGAGGFLGRHLIRHLTKLDYRIKVGTSNPFLKNYLLPLGNPGQISLFKTNIFNTEDIKEVLIDCDLVINLVGILYETKKQKFQQIHVNFPNLLSEICNELRISKLVHLSAIGANKDSQSKYQQSKFLGEQILLNNFPSTVILRPSVVIGEEDNFTNLFAKLSMFPVLPIVRGQYKFQPIYVEDVAKAIAKIFEVQNNEGKIYELGGYQQIKFVDMIKLILKIINKKRFIIDLPLSMAKLQSQILELLPGKPILTKDQCLILSGSDNIVSGKYLTISDLNIRPIVIEKVMSKWLWRYRSQGQFAKF